MAVLGSIVIGMRVDAQGVQGVLNKVANSLNKFGKSGFKDIAGGFGKIKDGAHVAGVQAAHMRDGLRSLIPGFQLAGSGAGQMAKGLLKLTTIPVAKSLRVIGSAIGALPQLAGMAFKVLTGGAVAAAFGLGTLAMASAHTIKTTGDTADRIGTTTAALQGLHYAAKLTGSSSESMDAALEKMNASMGKAAFEGGPAAVALERLGLKAEDLVKLDPTEAFKAISGGLAKVATPAEKAALAMEIFGKGGQQVLTTLNAGPAGIEKFAAEFKGIGGSVSETERQMVKAGVEGMERIGGVVEALGTQLAIGLSPFVEALAEQFVGVATEGGGMGEKVGVAIEWLGKGVGFLADAAQMTRIGFLALGVGGTIAVRGIVSAVEFLGKGLESLLNLIPGVKVEFTSALGAFREELDRSIGTQVAAMDKAASEESWSVKVVAGFNDIRDKAKASAEAIAKVAAATKKVGDEFVFTKAQLDDYAEHQKKLATDADSLYEKTRTPLEKYAAELEHIQEMQINGLIDKDTATRGQKQAGAEFDKSQETKFAGSMEQGSKEARSTILAATTGRTNGLEGTAKEQLKQQVTTNSLLADVRSLLGKPPAEARI